MGVFNAGTNSWNNRVSFATFDFSGGPVTVAVTVGFSFSSVSVAPASLGLSSTRAGQVVTFTLAGPADVSLIFDGNHQGRTLHVFAQAPDANLPSPTASNVIYFGPGYHEQKGAPIVVGSGQTLYLAAGAVLKARVRVQDANGASVVGHGVLVNDYKYANASRGDDDVALVVSNSTNVTIRGLTVNRSVGNWTGFIADSSFVGVSDYHVVSPTYASTDGFDIINSHDVSFNRVFIRSCDDAVSIKGYGDDYSALTDPSTTDAIYNISYSNSQLWADANNAIVVGEETIASSYSNIDFENIDILYSFDGIEHTDQLTDRAALTVLMLNSTQMSDIVFNNIRLERGKRLINLDIRNNFWFGSILGSVYRPGSISGVTFSNISSTSPGSNQIRMNGWDPTNQISNITLQNVVINGAQLSTFADPRLQISSQVSNVSIISSAGTKTLARGPVNISTTDDWPHRAYGAAHDFAPIAGHRGWTFQTWKSGVGYSPMSWNAVSNRWEGPQTWDNASLVGDWVSMHPDNNQVMMNWQAPASGTIRVGGIVRKGDTSGGDGVLVSVWKNGTKAWPAGPNWQPIAFNDASGVAVNALVTVAPSDVISFRIDQGGTITSDTTWWAPRIDYNDTYDAAVDMASTQPANGWSYRVWKAGVGFSTMTWDAGVSRWKGTGSWDRLWSTGSALNVHPDNNQILVDWSAPRSGTVRLSGIVRKGDTGGGDGVSVSIWKNGSKIWPAGSSWQAVGPTDGIGYNVDAATSVVAGDIISFRLDQGGSIANDLTSWAPRVSYQ